MSDSVSSLAKFFCLRHLFGETALAQPESLSLVQDAILAYLTECGSDSSSLVAFVNAALELQVTGDENDPDRALALLDVASYRDQPLFLRPVLLKALRSLRSGRSSLLLVCGLKEYSNVQKQALIAYVDAVCADWCQTEDQFQILYIPT